MHGNATLCVSLFFNVTHKVCRFKESKIKRLGAMHRAVFGY
jgi:hypothetical protein